MTNLCPKCGAALLCMPNVYECGSCRQDGLAQVSYECQERQLAKLRADNARLREALEALLDVQNGPPLITWADAWNEAVDNAQAALDAAKGGDSAD